jgi:tetratricopeptide (TPR) repeat protein
LERAYALAPLADVRRAPIGVDLAERLVEAGDVGRADELLCAAELEESADPVAALTRFEWLIRVRPQDATQTIEARLPGILRQLAMVNDQSGIARAHLVASMPHWLTSQWTLAGEQARLAAEHADQAGDAGARSRALAFYIGSIIYGQADVRAIARELDAIERNEPGASLIARIDLGRGQLARLRGDFAEARMFMQRAIEGFQALGMRELEAACHHELGVTELTAGDPRAALPWLLRSDASLADLGQHALRSTTQALVAQTEVSLNDRTAARAAIELAERLSAPEDILNFAITHRVRARLALSEGNAEGAVRWARSAVAHAFRTDSPEVRADATLDLARVLVALERPDDARSEARTALALFAAKGHRPGADQTRKLLDELGAST